MSPPIVDAHTHVWDLALTPQPWIPPDAAPVLARDFTRADLESAAAPTGVSQALVVQSVNVADETQMLLQQSSETRFVAGIVGWADLASPRSGELIDELLDGSGGGKLCGLRHVFAPGEAASWVHDRRVEASLRHLAVRELAFDVLVAAEELPVATSLARRFPEVTFVLDHLAKPRVRMGDLEPWRSQLTELAEAPNVLAKFSGLPGEADWGDWSTDTLRPYFDVALTAFSASRLIFATDWPVCTVAGSYAAVAGAQLELCRELSPAEQHAVLWGNAARAYARAGLI